MILTQSHKRRSFVGCLNAGTDFVKALRSLCVDNTILCGFFQAQGYLRDVKLRSFDAKTRAYGDVLSYSGTFQAVTLSGNISLIDRQTSIRCHTMGVVVDADKPPLTVAGELVSGEVVGIEFTLDTLDDIRLFRARDERSGLDGWLHVEFLPATGVFSRPEPMSPPTPPPQPRVTAARAEPAPPAPVESGAPEIRENDFLDHPTLGRCVVVSAEQDERLTIRLESGRLVELHTGLIDIAPSKPGPDKTRIFSVAIKRRRG